MPCENEIRTGAQTGSTVYHDFHGECAFTLMDGKGDRVGGAFILSFFNILKSLLSIYLSVCLSVCLSILGPHPWHMEVPRLGGSHGIWRFPG